MLNFRKAVANITVALFAICSIYELITGLFYTDLLPDAVHSALWNIGLDSETGALWMIIFINVMLYCSVYFTIILPRGQKKKTIPLFIQYPVTLLICNGAFNNLSFGFSSVKLKIMWIVFAAFYAFDLVWLCFAVVKERKFERKLKNET